MIEILSCAHIYLCSPKIHRQKKAEQNVTNNGNNNIKLTSVAIVQVND